MRKAWQDGSAARAGVYEPRQVFNICDQMASRTHFQSGPMAKWLAEKVYEKKKGLTGRLGLGIFL